MRQRCLKGQASEYVELSLESTFAYTDPFILLDHLGQAEYAPSEAMGAPDHPHRGYETVTYMMDGELEHRDSNGTEGLITDGAPQ